MEAKVLIKICGVTDPETAFAAAKLGASFIGLVFYCGSKRYVDIKQAIKITKATKLAGALPVGVFVDNSAEEITAICAQTGINIAQLHGHIAKSAASNLKKLQRIYVINVGYDGSIIQENMTCLNLSKERDYILFDGIDHGSGKNFNFDNFKPNTDFKFFIAGGLNPENVNKVITKFHPVAVDVSTGVENSSGVKDLALIEKFITQVKNRN